MRHAWIWYFLFVFVVVIVAHIKAIEGFSSPPTDDYKKAKLCESRMCKGKGDACVVDCYTKIKDIELCPANVLKVERTDENGFMWGSFASGKRCIHLL